MLVTIIIGVLEEGNALGQDGAGPSDAICPGHLVPRLDPSGLSPKVLAEAAEAEARHIRDTGHQPRRFVICGDGAVIAIS